ncbi:SRPBCC family protein [Williamsia sterculiae]|uniref:Polyketide cyclase / dehydrase and lipid transport n=1 Tax=Williamsia sterculiae TaxID=1344003 RepID=A0A1N7ER31_9NOCA|nr:SRPBCC family protein [Williamsia sterculiae]SIR90504.1 Polyketide cyclase / dehydrase and lipid transport [Williamsia sterculiae]
MQTINLSRFIPAPIDIVFDEFTDHERLSDLPMAVSSTVVVPGKTEKNGLGAVRRLNAVVVQLREEITAFDRPRLMEYRIIWSFPKARHELGRVEFSEVNGGTRVTWSTVFTVELPIIGDRVDRAFSLLFSKVFATVLHQMEKRSVARAGREGR